MKTNFNEDDEDQLVRHEVTFCQYNNTNYNDEMPDDKTLPCVIETLYELGIKLFCVGYSANKKISRRIIIR